MRTDRRAKSRSVSDDRHGSSREVSSEEANDMSLVLLRRRTPARPQGSRVLRSEAQQRAAVSDSGPGIAQAGCSLGAAICCSRLNNDRTCIGATAGA